MRSDDELSLRKLTPSVIDSVLGANDAAAVRFFGHPDEEIEQSDLYDEVKVLHGLAANSKALNNVIHGYAKAIYGPNVTVEEAGPVINLWMAAFRQGWLCRGAVEDGERLEHLMTGS